jgi:acetolactate decarboxylase
MMRAGLMLLSSSYPYAASRFESSQGNPIPHLTVDVYQSLLDALTTRCAVSGESIRHLVCKALSDALGLEHSTLFQVSTSGALVQGVFDKAVTVGQLKMHGDFGLGTFEGLDGEMVVLDGKFYQAHDDGRITVPPDSAPVPFATLVHFRPERRAHLGPFASMAEFTAALDKLRRSDNLFTAVRIDGHFDEVHWRVACKVESGVHLDTATEHQAEFRRSDVSGTMAGFWSPAYSKAISVAGWHLHFLTDNRESGGHVLGCKAAGLEAQVHAISDLHLALPETREFLHADLTQDPSAALDKAEQAHDRQ